MPCGGGKVFPLSGLPGGFFSTQWFQNQNRLHIWVKMKKQSMFSQAHNQYVFLLTFLEGNSDRLVTVLYLHSEAVRPNKNDYVTQWSLELGVRGSLLALKNSVTLLETILTFPSLLMLIVPLGKLLNFSRSVPSSTYLQRKTKIQKYLDRWFSLDVKIFVPTPSDSEWLGWNLESQMFTKHHRWQKSAGDPQPHLRTLQVLVTLNDL